MRARSALPTLLVLASMTFAAPAGAVGSPADLHQALRQLAREGKFSGAVVIRGEEGVRFARGYGFADPFLSRRYTPDTPADSGSAPKPMTAAAVLMLASEGTVDLDSPVVITLPNIPMPRRQFANFLPIPPVWK